MNQITNPITLPDAIERDGIVHYLGAMCVQALGEAAAAATPERFVHLAAQQVADVGELTPDRVAEHLHATLKALVATAKELETGQSAGRG